MTATQDFEDDPLSFIRHYYVVVSKELHKPAQKYIGDDGTVMIKLEDTTSDYLAKNVTRPRNRKGLGKLAAKYGGIGQSVKVTRQYTIKLASSSDTDAVPAYVCPYVMGETHTAVVGNGAKLMITAEMTGCTFGVGSTTTTGRMVCHSNDADAGQDGGAAGQEAAQQGATRDALGEAGQLFEPNQYRSATTTVDTRAAIVGFQDGADWQFWAQVFLFTGMGRVDLNVIQIA
jgi:hypothetical protein